MSQVTVFQCDGPDCLRSDDESIEEACLLEAGWLIVSLTDDEEQRQAHLCSYRCLSGWAGEMVE